jgi:hypothetical protein
MSTWTSKIRPTVALATVGLFLAACVMEGQGGGSAPAAVPGGVALAAPSGYCLVDSTRQIRGDADLAAFRLCPGRSGPDAILTVAIGGAGSAEGLRFDGAEIPAYFTSEAGRRALSRSDDPRSVTVHEVRRAGDAVLLRLSDRAQPGGQNAWRAVTGLRGRLVTLALRAPGDGAPLAGPDAEQLIGHFLATMRAANR